jgi:hypothetical protein
VEKKTAKWGSISRLPNDKSGGDMKILDFRKFEKNTLRGFFSAELPSGLCVRDLTYHVKNDSRWIGYPSKPYQDSEGKTQYQNQIWFEDKDRHYKFQNQLLAALDEYLPKTLDDVPWEGDDEIVF